MTKDDRGYVICLLLPGLKYRGCWYDDSIRWLDERPCPDEYDIEMRYDQWQREKWEAEILADDMARYDAALDRKKIKEMKNWKDIGENEL